MSEGAYGLAMFTGSTLPPWHSVATSQHLSSLALLSHRACGLVQQLHASLTSSHQSVQDTDYRLT